MNDISPRKGERSIRKNILSVCTPSYKTTPPVTISTPFPGFAVHSLRIRENKELNTPAEDMLAYLQRARAEVRKHQIDGIIFGTDAGSLVAAILCAECGLPGPNLDAAFRCYHKFYTRAATECPVRYKLLDIQDQCPKLLPYPFFLKAPCSCFGRLGFTIRSKDDLHRALALARAHLPRMNAPAQALFETCLPKEKFPHAFRDVMLMEELAIGEWQGTVEGYVRNGEIRFTVITDTNRFPGTNLIDNFSLPTRLSAKQQHIVQSQAQKDIAALGIDHSFFNAEYCLNDGKALLYEVNCRPALVFELLYRKALGYSARKAALSLAAGEEPDIRMDPRCVAGQFNVLTTRNGNSSDLLDYDVPPPVLMMLNVRKNTPVKALSEFGTVLAQIELFGSSYEEIKSIADAYRKRALKRQRPLSLQAISASRDS